METKTESGTGRALLRITSFGTLSIVCWQPSSEDIGVTNAVPVSADRVQGRGTALALTLLKVLLCQPSRFTSRDLLMETLWPDSPHGKAQARLDDTASLLRMLLRSVSGSGENLLPAVHSSKGSGNGYQLAGYPLVWLDVDAFLWNMEQAARMERFEDDPLAYWERAYVLASRGTFLADEPYSEWASERRDLLAGHYRQCVLRLAALYSQVGGTHEAIVRLRTFMQAHPTDDDVLYPLMEQLGRIACYQEALERYQRAGVLLEQEGKAPTERTQELAAYLQLKQRQVTSIRASSSSLFTRQEPGASSKDLLLNTHGQEHASEIDIVNRRNALQKLTVAGLTLITAPYELLNPQSWKDLSDLKPKSTNIDPTTLSYFEDLTKACWHLSKGGELEVAERTLWGYLPKLAAMAEMSSEYQRPAAQVASQGYLLAALLAGHRDDLNARESYCEQALLFADIAEDRNLQVASLRQLALTFDYKDRQGKALLTYQQSISYLGETSPLLRSRMYAGLSGSHAHFQQEEEARRFLDLAYESFPEKPEDDPSFLYADCEYFTLLLWDGLTHLDLNQLKEAETAFARVDGLHPKIPVPERVRIEFLNYQVETFTKLRDLEQARTYLEEAVSASLALGSERRYSQAFEVYKQMRMVWHNEPQVKALGDLFSR